jgi:hypothetical protein
MMLQEQSHLEIVVFTTTFRFLPFSLRWELQSVNTPRVENEA